MSQSNHNQQTMVQSNNTEQTIEFRQEKFSPSQLSQALYNEVFNAGIFYPDHKLYTLAAVKCWQNVQEKELSDQSDQKENNFENMHKELLEILAAHDSWLISPEIHKRRAQAFCLMYCGQIAPISSTDIKYRTIRHYR